METIVMSPKRRLRLELGLPEVPSRSGLRAGDWLAFGCGDRVREKEGRHVGRVEAVISGTLVRVKWENGWISEHDADDLILVKTYDQWRRS